MSTTAASQARAKRLALLGLLAGIALCLVKLVSGIVGHSYALIADAVESMTDIVASVVVWGGLHVSARPADETHPYGHGRAESLAALAVGAMIAAAGVAIAVQSIHEILNPGPAPAAFTIVVLIVVIIVKEALARLVGRAARDTGSSAVRADAGHHRSDALTSLAAAIGISVALIGGPGYESADGWAALIASAVILFNAWNLLRAPVRELMDAHEPEIAGKATQLAAAVPGVANIQTVRLRRSGSTFWIEMHVRVAPDMTVREAHTIAHAVKDDVRRAIPRVADVLVHIEPAAPN